MDLLSQIVARAKANKQRIVLPEAEEERTLCAADRVLADDIANIILIGNPEKVHALAKEKGLTHIGDSNARPLRPERSALPTALHPDACCTRFFQIECKGSIIN